MNEDEPRYITNKELKDELEKRPTKYEVLFYIATATLVGRFIPSDAPKQVAGTVVSWLF